MQSHVAIDQHRRQQTPDALLVIFWVLALTGMGFLAGAMQRDVPVVPDAAAVQPQTVHEDWHGNVRRSGGGG